MNTLTDSAICNPHSAINVAAGMVSDAGLSASVTRENPERADHGSFIAVGEVSHEPRPCPLETPAAPSIAECGMRNAESTSPSIPASHSALRIPHSALQVQTAHRRLQSLCAFGQLLKDGRGAAVAMRLVGLSGATRSRLEKDLRAAGLPLPTGEVPAELLPQYLDALTPGLPTGCPPKFPLTEQEALVLRGLALAKSTQDALHFAMAVEEFANHPACRPETRALILDELDRAARLRRCPSWPVAIRRCGTPTMQEAAHFRGRKHAQELEQTDRRGCYWIDETGRRHPLLPHTIWEMDDASDNEPRRSLDPDTGDTILTRQALWTQDVFSAALLGLTQVARPRDSYRIEDVADHVLRCVEAWGLPQIMRLEMGEIWAGQFFHGFVPMVGSTRQIVPGWPESETWGGLAPLCRVINVFKSKGKGGIESSFNLVQTIAAHRSLSIGRSRGEFEEATTALIRSHRTAEIDERFWDMDTSSDAMRAVAEKFNLRPKLRRMFGRDAVAPIDLLRAINNQQSPILNPQSAFSRGLPLIPSERWRFCPIKRLATVRGGHVEINVGHYPQNFRFRVNGNGNSQSSILNHQSSIHLDHGYQVLVAFHPGRPEEGCHIFNAELGVRNRDGLRRAERLMLAPFAEDCPQVDLSGRADFTPRKKAAAAVRRNFRAIGEAMRADYAQDSTGRHLLVEERNGERTVVARNAERETRSDVSPSPGGEGRGEGGPQVISAAARRDQLREQAAIARRLLALQDDD